MMGNGNAEQCLFITVCVYFMSNLFFLMRYHTYIRV